MTESNASAGPPEGPHADTKTRILDAAERLFAEKGFAGTSLRSIIAKAGVNLAAVHYHFGSKEQLLKAVVARRIDPVNQRRLALLDACERAAGAGAPALDLVVDAFVRPMFHVWFSQDTALTKLIGRLLGEPEFFEKVASEQFLEVRQRFVAAFGRAMPWLGAEELFWKLILAVGSVTFALRVSDYLPVLSGGICGEVDEETVMRRVTSFLLGGFQANPEGAGA